MLNNGSNKISGQVICGRALLLRTIQSHRSELCSPLSLYQCTVVAIKIFSAGSPKHTPGNTQTHMAAFCCFMKGDFPPLKLK